MSSHYYLPVSHAVARFLSVYVVHSRPSDAPSTEISLSKDKELPPWVITFDNFIAPEECEAMIQLVRRLVIGSFHALVRSFFLTLLLFMLDLRRDTSTNTSVRRMWERRNLTEATRLP
jgi:hypothetical protein